jgi:DNA-binding GntR family transcriptional regulator
MILAGSLSPGDPIRQDALAARLNVSKIPLREALSRLEQYGLVEAHPNRGYFVSSLRTSEFEEVYALRLKLEPEATGKAALIATDVDHARAKQALASLEQDIAANRPSVGESNREFHLALLGPIREGLTYDIIARLNVLADRYVRKHLEPKGRDRRADKEHRDILKAWLKGDADAVERMVRSHIEKTLKDLRVEIEA